MTLRELSEIVYQNIDYDNEMLKIRKVHIEDGVLEIIFWGDDTPTLYICDLDFSLDDPEDL